MTSSQMRFWVSITFIKCTEMLFTKCVLSRSITSDNLEKQTLVIDPTVDYFVFMLLLTLIYIFLIFLLYILRTILDEIKSS